MWFIKTFDQVNKHNFDQTPILLENFDQVIWSSEIRSSDPLSFNTLVIIFYYNVEPVNLKFNNLTLIIGSIEIQPQNLQFSQIH